MGTVSLKQVIVVLLILGISVLIYGSQGLRREYKSEVKEVLARTNTAATSIITEQDIAHLPEPVQNYLRYVGVLGKETVNNLRVVIDGSMKMDKDRDWASVEVEQYSSFDTFTRLFFIDMSMSGMPILGLHNYKDATATMVVKVAGLVPVVKGVGERMNHAETVTVLNDMSLLAPATLVDERISWEPIDALSAKAIFNNEGIEVTATLHFNEEGRLINFVSDDRYYSPTGDTYKSVRWSTPVSDYQNINGFNLPTYGEAVWNFPEGDFPYARFNVKEVEYNTDTLR